MRLAIKGQPSEARPSGSNCSKSAACRRADALTIGVADEGRHPAGIHPADPPGRWPKAPIQHIPKKLPNQSK